MNANMKKWILSLAAIGCLGFVPSVNASEEEVADETEETTEQTALVEVEEQEVVQ